MTTRPALRFVSADVTTGIVAYAVASQHDASRTNIISLDTTNGMTYCDCKAGECHHSCWHIAAVHAVWAVEVAATGVVYLTDAHLLRYGRKAAAMVALYGARIGRSLASDRVEMLAARQEYRRRQARGLLTTPDAATAPLALPVPVAA